MKTLGLKMVMLFILMVGGTAVMAQMAQMAPDSYRDQNVPGDDFSLEGALDLFKQSASPAEFERKLNSPEAKVNNLDLNGDGEIDYIRVIDRNEGNIHAFILQAVLSSTESQDVAVIELEKLANGKAVLQIIGDEDVYGIETIIEPTEEVRVMAGASTARTVVNVWSWPSVQYVYSPYYSVWVSPWHWYYRPIWWYSWRPIAYYDYYSYWSPYRRYYSTCHTYRIEYARNIYRPYRSYSPTYYRRHETRITHYRSNYRSDSYRNDRNRYNYDHDRNKNYGDRTNRDRYDGKRDNNTAERTPAVRQRSSGSFERERTMVNTTPVKREHKPSFEKPVKRNEPVYTNRSEVKNKPVERSSDFRNKPVVERSSPRNERSVTTNTERNSPRNERSNSVNTNRGSQKLEMKSFDKPSRSGGGEVKSNGNGRSNSDGNGKGNGGNGSGKGNGRKH